MAAAVGNLAVNIIANTSGFTSGIHGVRQQVASLPSVLGQATSGLSSFASKMLGLVGVTIGAAAAVRSLSSSMDAIDKVAKLSDSTGISTEALVGLQHAATLAGSSTEGLDKSLNKMVRTIGDAVSGERAQVQALSDIGLSANTLAAQSPDEAFGRIADAINKLPTAAERAAAAVAIFGKSGQDLLPTLALGSSGLAAARKEAEQLGITFSRLDAAKVEEANDAITRMKEAAQGLFNVLAIELAPVITAVSQAVQGMLVWWHSLSDVSQTNILRFAGFAAALGASLLVVPRIISAVGALIRVFRALAAGQILVQSLSGPAGWATLAASVAIAAGATYGLGVAFDSLESNAAAAAEVAQKQTAPSISEVRDSAAEAAAETKRLAAEMEQMRSQAERIAEQVRTPFEVAQDGIAEVQRLFDAGLLTLETYTRQVAKIGQEYVEASKEAEKLQAIQKEQSVGAVTRGTTAGFSAALDGAREQAKQSALQKQQLEEDKKQTQLLTKLIDTVKDKAPNAAVVLNEASL